MTNVPGPGFVALLAVAMVLLALPVLAGVSLLVAKLSGVRLEWSLLTIHAVGIVAGVLLVGLTSPLGMTEPSSAVGLLRFGLAVLAAGLAIAAVAAGGPIAVGAALAVVVGDTSWERGVWYATVGYAGGGVGGAVVSLALTGSPIAAAAGAILATPAALTGLAIERVVSQSRWGVAAS